ncbi:MAG: molecular chaperone [Pseudomonadales bacterium]
MTLKFRASICTALVLASMQADASSLQASPISVTIDAAKGATSLTLKNTGEAPIQAQVRLVQWKQAGNSDVLEPTEEILASPPFTTIPAHSTQLVRVVVADASLDVAERNYRVIVDELPETGAAIQKGITVNLRYSIPIRVVGAVEAARPSLVTRWSSSGKSVALTIQNDGNGRAQLSSVKANVSGGEEVLLENGLLGYVLPGAARTWTFQMPSDAAAKSIRSFTAVSNGATVNLNRSPE